VKQVKQIEFGFELARILSALGIAFAATLICILAISEQPLEALYNFVAGPFSTPRRFGQMIGKFIPYLLTGCGMCFVYASNRFNLIGEGVYLFAGCISAWFAVTFGALAIPHAIMLFILILIGAGTGAALGFVPAVLREKLKANEVVVSIMMNYALLYCSLYILKTRMYDPAVTFMASREFNPNVKFGALIANTNIHSGLFIGILAVVATSLIFYKTPLGYAIRICGSNADFAKASGINVNRTLIIAQMLGAVFAGVGGAIDVFGIYNRYLWTALTNMGFDGLLVAVLSKKNPIFIPLGAFLLAYMRTGAAILNYSTKIPIEFVDIMQAIIILLVAAENFMGGIKRKLIFKSAYERTGKEELAK
jgi:simple sugar transport system permease protein